jgi:hypothetical protein
MNQKANQFSDVTMRYQAQALAEVFSDTEELARYVIKSVGELSGSLEQLNELKTELNRLPRQIIVQLSAFIEKEHGMHGQVKRLLAACECAQKVLDTRNKNDAAEAEVHDHLRAPNGLSGIVNDLVTLVTNLTTQHTQLASETARLTTQHAELATETKALADATKDLVEQNKGPAKSLATQDEDPANVLDLTLWQLIRAWFARHYTLYPGNQ